MCRPNGGGWLGFRVGMSKSEALEAGCNAVLRGQVKSDAFMFSDQSGRCLVNDRVADTSGKWAVYSQWSLDPVLARRERHCYGPKDEVLWLNFAQETGELTDISVGCVVTLP